MFTHVINGCIIASTIIILGIYTTIIRIEKKLDQFMEERRR